jgi:DNA polymerase-3 subunit alpha
MRGKGVRTLLEARAANARALQLSLDEADFSGDFGAEFRRLLEGSLNGGCPLVIDYRRRDARVRLRLDDQWRVQPSDELLTRLKERYGAERVQLSY